jgi:hypothetical protein
MSCFLRRASLLALCLPLALACAHAQPIGQLTDGGASVVLVPEKPDYRCVVVGEVTARQAGWSYAGSGHRQIEERANNELRNEAFLRGATHVRVSEHYVHPSSTTAITRMEFFRGVAYRCAELSAAATSRRF